MTDVGISDAPRADTAAMVHAKVLALLDGVRGRLLDAPAGEGALAAGAARQGFEVSCADIDPSRFKLDGIHCERLDLDERWPYENGLFDAVVSIEAVEHLENPWHLMREAARVLKAGGLFILTTPNVLTIRSRLSYLLYGYPNYFHYMIEADGAGRGERPVDHINPIGFLELRHILSRCGFRVETLEANRLVKRGSPIFRFIRTILRTRGRSHVRENPSKARVRDLLLSDILLFGEILIIKARKPSGA